MERRLGRSFFARHTVDVARDLVGAALVADPGTDDEVVARLVEVEAYLGTADEASHAHRGPTPRARIMFGDPGHLYVYLSYGVHHCANLVTETPGVAGAVLLRAAAVESGERVVRRRRGLDGEPGRGARWRTDRLLSGPGNLCRGLALHLGDNGIDVCHPRSRLTVVAGSGLAGLGAGPRVGITRARDAELRFAWPGHPAVSGPPVGVARRPGTGGAAGRERRRT